MYVTTTINEQSYIFNDFPGSKNYWKGNHFLNIFGFRKCLLKKIIPLNFWPQIFSRKSGISSAFSMTFMSRKILMSPVKGLKGAGDPSTPCLGSVQPKLQTFLT